MTAHINRRVLPGFGLSLGFTIFFLSPVILADGSGVAKASGPALRWTPSGRPSRRRAAVLTGGRSLQHYAPLSAHDRF